MLDTLVTATLVKDIATLNLMYLGLCVTIILFAGGLFYVFNFRPLQKSIEKHDDRFSDMDNEVSMRIGSMRTEMIALSTAQAGELRTTLDRATEDIGALKSDADKRINRAESMINGFAAEAKEELATLRKTYQRIELDALWQEHWMWEAKGVLENSLVVLLEYMKKATEYKNTRLTDLWLGRVQTVLNRLGKYDYEKDREKTHKDLLEAISPISGYQSQKEAIIELAATVFSNTSSTAV